MILYVGSPIILSCGMLVVLQMQSSEEVVSKDNMSEDLLTVHLPVNKKKRSSISMWCSNPVLSSIFFLVCQ
jgi:hypothetical protein